MGNYLIEVPHDEDKQACMRAIQIFVESGSHFLAKADWGCSDDEHKAWLLVDVETKEQALQIVPPLYRQRAKITKLFKVTKEDVKKFKKEKELEGSIKTHHK
jgi:hypothetical protein